MHISPSAKIDDGKITICLLDAVSRPRTMVIFPSLMIEKHVLLKEVHFVDCEEVTITSQSPIPLCLDGNLYPEANELNFKILPKALEILV